LREERSLRVFEKRVMRRIFGSERDEGIGECRQLHNEELNDLCSPPNIIWVIKSRRMRWEVHVAHMEKRRGVYRVLEGKPEGKGTLGRSGRRREDNIKRDLQEFGCVTWTGMLWLWTGTGGGPL